MDISVSFIIAQIFGTISGLFLVFSGWQKTHKKILLFQIIDCSAAIISYLLLGGYSAVIITSTALIRNILSYKKIINKNITIFFIVLSIITTFFTSDMSKIINYTPLVASVLYTYSLSSYDANRIKKFLIVNSLLWLIYNISIRAYSSAVTSLVLIVVTSLSLKTKNKN